MHRTFVSTLSRLLLALTCLAAAFTTQAATFRYNFNAGLETAVPGFGEVTLGEKLLSLEFDSGPAGLNQFGDFEGVLHPTDPGAIRLVRMRVFNWGEVSPQHGTVEADLSTLNYDGHILSENFFGHNPELDGGFINILGTQLPDPQLAAPAPSLIYAALFESEFRRVGGDLLMINGHAVFGDWSGGVVPVPAAAWLFGSALLGLGGFSRLKKPQAHLIQRAV